MSGAKTRFGFAGDGSEPPDSDEARGARTMIGHDIHLPVPQGLGQPASPPLAQPLARPFVAPRRLPTPQVLPPMSQAAVPGFVDEEKTADLPSRRARPHRSRLARFLGRWTDSGRFVSESELSRDRGRDDYSRVPRDPLARNVLLVLVVAVVTFFLTLLLVRVRQHVAATTPGRGASIAAVAHDASGEPVPRL